MHHFRFFSSRGGCPHISFRPALLLVFTSTSELGRWSGETIDCLHLNFNKKVYSSKW